MNSHGYKADGIVLLGHIVPLYIANIQSTLSNDIVHDGIVVLLPAAMDFACHKRSPQTPLIDHATFFNRVKRSVVALNHPASTCHSPRPRLYFPVQPSTTRARVDLLDSLLSAGRGVRCLIKTRSKWRPPRFCAKPVSMVTTFQLIQCRSRWAMTTDAGRDSTSYKCYEKRQEWQVTLLVYLAFLPHPNRASKL